MAEWLVHESKIFLIAGRRSTPISLILFFDYSFLKHFLEQIFVVFSLVFANVDFFRVAEQLA